MGTDELPPPEKRVKMAWDTPLLPEICWRTGFNEFRAAYSGCTEACDAFLFGGYMVIAGTILGRRAQIESSFKVYPNIYLTNVGSSGKSRKTTAQEFAIDLLEQVDTSVEYCAGIGSPEGLLTLLAKREGQRLLIDLTETSTLLHKGAQEATRGLLPFITALFDCKSSVRLPNRGSDTVAKDPFMSIIGSSTAEWLHSSLRIEDIRGGLAGRFLYIVGKEKAPIPFPPPPDAKRLEAAIFTLFQLKTRFKEARKLTLSEAAREIWGAWYVEERARVENNDILDCLAQRLHIHALKLALIYAALEGTEQITEDQIRAACAFADYQRASQRAIFEEVNATKSLKLDNRIVGILRVGDAPTWRLSQLIKEDVKTLNERCKALESAGIVAHVEGGRKGLWHLITES